MADPKLYISRITLPDGKTYEIKDAEARELIAQIAAGSLAFVKCTAAGDTPDGVTWDDDGTSVVGTLTASSETNGKIYLVPSVNGKGKDIFDEYTTINTGTKESPTWIWEKLGDTEINFDNLGQLATKNSVTLNKQSDSVLGVSTTFTNAASAVTFSGDSSDTFVKSYPGSTQKLATTSIKGVGATDVTFNAIDSDPGTVTATKVVFGTDTSASVVTKAAKQATNVVLGEADTASKATAGTAVSLAKPAAAATNVSYIGNASTANVLETATVSGETLTIGKVAVVQGQVTGTNGSESITPYTFADVSVPVITSNTVVSFDAIDTLGSVVVPVVSSSQDVTAAGQITLASKTAATSAANAITVATGKVAATDANGDDVLVDLGTAVTGSAVTGLGTATAAAQTITVGTNDQVTALTSGTDVTVA